jgi:leader peptidase (prepilin peptidase) / N-methyltransferase
MDSAVATNIVVMRAAFACILAGILLALAIADFHRMILPNRLNLLLAAAGASQSIIAGQPGVIDAALGAFVGGACLMMVAALFRRYRGVDGLGRGDLKLVAAAGIWTGWQGIPVMLLVASVSALAFVAIRVMWNREFDSNARMPFGPFLGAGAFFAWLAAAT